MASWQEQIEQRAKSGLTIGQQWFNSVGGQGGLGIDAATAANYARGRGFALGQNWAAMPVSAPPQAPPRVETWSAGMNGAGVSGGPFDGVIDYNAKPTGEGWQITGYRGAPTFFGKNGWGTRQVPIYTRTVGSGQAQAPAPPAPTPAPNPDTIPKDPTPLVPQPTISPYQSQLDDILRRLGDMQNQAAQPASQLQMPEMKISTGSAIAGNAAGFTRKQSSARKAGLTSKGTGRLRINRTGQTSASSGLNIGV